MSSAVFHVEGGIGKHIAASAVIEAYKKQNPTTKVYTVCAWPEVFTSNPNVDRVFLAGKTPYFYEDYIYNKDVEIFAQEPYKQTSHILKNKHIIETWCNLVGVPYNNESPKLYFNFRELELSLKLIESVPKDKPLLLFQPFGGPGKQHQQTPYSWVRDIHPNFAQQLINILKDTYNIVHVCYDFHPKLENCFRFDNIVSKKQLFGLLPHFEKRLLIDSSLQHAAAALGLSSTVVWVATQPHVFGYNIHNNITPNEEFPRGTVDSYLYDYNFTGAIHECPYESPNQIFSIDKIIQSL